jgi:hypothetical protein
MRPVVRGSWPTDEGGNLIRFSDYKEARDALISTMGNYCSYCENARHSAIDFRDLRENDTESMRQAIVLTAISRGFWSVWMQVFEQDTDMRRRFITWFQGTALDCFDRSTSPVPRPRGRKDHSRGPEPAGDRRKARPQGQGRGSPPGARCRLRQDTGDP